MSGEIRFIGDMTRHKVMPDEVFVGAEVIVLGQGLSLGVVSRAESEE